MAEESDREDLKINLCYTEMNGEDQEKTLQLVLEALKQDSKSDTAVYQKILQKASRLSSIAHGEEHGM